MKHLINMADPPDEEPCWTVLRAQQGDSVQALHNKRARLQLVLQVRHMRACDCMQSCCRGALALSCLLHATSGFGAGIKMQSPVCMCPAGVQATDCAGRLG